MNAAMKWRWAYVPVIIVLGLIWYEFWSSGVFKGGENAPVSQGTPETMPVAETIPATAAATVSAATKAVVQLPPEPVLDPFDQLLKEPPPISLSVQNATLKQTIDALNKTLSPAFPIQFGGGAQDSKLISLEIKNKSFWEVLEAIEAQSPFEVQDNGNGFRVVQYGQGIRNFERRGPIMIYPTQFAYVRTNSGQMQPGGTRQARMQLNIMLAIDPRVHVIRHMPLALLGGEDDLGQAIDVNQQNNQAYSTSESNVWQQGVSWPAPDKMGKNMAKLQFLVRYTALGGETETSLEDVENKKDQTFDFGERRLRLARCDVNNGRLQIQVVPADEQSDPPKTTLTIVNGQGVSIGTIQGVNGQVPAGGGPYKLVVKGPRTKEVSTTLELQGIPLP